MCTPRKRSWEKVLYKHQPYPDNYTDKTLFLRDLRTQIKYVTFREAFLGATLLLNEFCTVVAFVLIYVFMYNNWTDPDWILRSSSSLTFCGFLIYRLIYTKDLFSVLGNDLRTLLIFVVFGHLLSPIFHTLTDTVSTDTIYTMTFFMLLVHLIFFDYGISAAIVSNSLSLSAAIFASICLASRLGSAYQAFILISVAVELFVLFPLLRKKLGTFVLATIALTLLDIYFLLYSGSYLVVIMFISVSVFINAVCPVLFVNYQKDKQNIYGPWDEAIVEDKDNWRP